MVGWIVYAVVGFACAGKAIQSGKENGFSEKLANGIAFAVMAVFLAGGVWFHYS